MNLEQTFRPSTDCILEHCISILQEGGRVRVGQASENTQCEYRSVNLMKSRATCNKHKIRMNTQLPHLQVDTCN